MATAASRLTSDLSTTFTAGAEGHLPETAAAVPAGLRFVARQPILDAHGHVHGYELLFRGSATSAAYDGQTPDSATRTVLDNTVIFGTEQLSGGLPLFINCTQEAILNDLVLVLPPKQTVLEILETLEPTPALIEACRKLKLRGYRLALDDFEWRQAWQPLLEMADYVKVDLSSTTPRQRAELKKLLGRSSARLILERVETRQDLALARREGFSLFQGFYFCRPQILQNREVPANRIVHLKILHAALNHPMDVRKISEMVKLEPSLTYRLLRMANSPIYATRKTVSSIQGALVMIGDEMFRRVALLATAAELRGNRPVELLRMAFLRARFCELGAVLTAQDATEQYLMGILSLLPAMLGVSMESVARALPLRAEVHAALVGVVNPERTLLGWLEHYELGQWEQCDRIALAAGLDQSRLPCLYAEALLWAELNARLASPE